MRAATPLDASHADSHPRLERVRRIIVDGSCAVLSLDIFDTVLWRRVPHPTDLFGMLGTRLRRAGMLSSWVQDASFRLMRLTAEHEARTSDAALGTEVSLFDIWRAMPLSVFNGAKLEELVDAEVALERELTVVDLDIADIIQLAHAQHIPIVLVSDTYFTEEQLSYLLDRPELQALKDARIFRSHEHGTDKASGLWDIVLNDLGRRPEQLVHIGDNEVADHEVPSDLGVRTVHYEQIDSRFGPVLVRERQPMEAFDPLATHIDPEFGDFGMTSLRAKALQSAAVGVGTSAVSTAWRFGASVLGPVLTGFAEWAAFQAHETGTSTLWCPMREGELLSTLITNAARARGWQVQAKPVWLSRHVTSVATMDQFTPEAIEEFIAGRYQLTVRNLLTMLDLRPGEVPGLAAELDTLLAHDALVERVSVALTETPHVANRLKATITAKRERLVAALRDCGALDDPELTLVDLGWGGSIQLHLARVLRIAQVDTTVSGLYLATNERSMTLLRQGLRAEGYLGQAGYPYEIVAAASRSPEVLEQSVNSLCGSLLDFTDDGAPVLGIAAGAPSQNAERQAVQDGVLAFQQLWNRYVASADGGWPELTGSAHRRLANILTSALRAPTPEEASVFGTWQHEDNYGSTVVTRVVPDDLLPAIPYLSPNDLDDLHMRDSFWPQLLAASDTHLASAAHALAMGLVDADMFEFSGDRFDTSVRYRTGDREWHDGPHRRVRINHNGLSFACMHVHACDIVDMDVAVAGRPAIARVDWIEVVAVVGADSRPRTLRWEEPEDFARLSFQECTWLGGNMVEFHTPGSALRLPLVTAAGAPVTSARITIAFAMLPLSMSRFGHRVAPATVSVSDRVREVYRAQGVTGVAVGAGRMAGEIAKGAGRVTRRWLAGS